MDTQEKLFLINKLEFEETYCLLPGSWQWCIGIVDQGTGSLRHQNLIYDFGPGDCFILHEQEPLFFSCNPGMPASFFLTAFRSESIELQDISSSNNPILTQFLDSSDLFLHFFIPPRNYDTLHSYLLLFDKLQQESFPVSPLVYRHTFLAFLLYLSQTYFIVNPEKQNFRKYNSRETLVAQVKQLICLNYADPLPLTHLAESVFANPSYLSRIFKETTGMCLSAYINQIRLENVKQLLKDTDELIIDIASACGFTQIAHFNRCFKKYTGMSPSVFRKTYRYRVR